MVVGLAAVLGACVGSFLNVVIHRVPRGGSLVRPPSACPSCGAEIRPRDNVPILSWLLLRGRCRVCKAAISRRYPLIEALTAGVFATAVLRFPDLEEAAWVAAAGAVFVALGAIDLEHRRVPNVIVLPATAAFLVWAGASSLVRGELQILGLALAGGACFFVLLLVIALVSPGGMGMGDVKLAALIGVVTGRFGLGATLVSVFAAFMIGGLIAVAFLALGRGGRKSAIPFAPMLCSGALVGLLAAEPILALWLGI